jgi:PAS domain S-box-containing protein
MKNYSGGDFAITANTSVVLLQCAEKYCTRQRRIIMKLTTRIALIPIFIVAFVWLLFGSTVSASPTAEQETKRVFILNSFNRGYTWTDNMLRGIDDTFGSSGIKVETYVTFMDMKRISPTPQYFSRLKELIQEGYKDIHFDAVLVCDNDAMEFIRKYRDELFPGVPVVFSSVNDFNERLLDGRKDITGTSENTDYEGTIKVALRLRSATKNIVVVTDATTTGMAHRSAVEKIRNNFPQSVTFTYLSLGDMSLNELAQKLSLLSSDSIVLLLQHFVDKTGTAYTVQESTLLLTKSSSVPVFVVSDIRMGLGTLGGDVVSGYYHGKAAAQMVVKILNGTDVKSIPVLLDSPNKFMFDYRVMQRFNIAEDNLPQGSIVINKPVSLLDEFRPYVFTSLGIFIILCTLLVYLLFEIRKRKKIEAALRENEAVFDSFLEYSPIYVFFKDKQVRSLRLSKNYEQMLGMPINQLLGKTMDELFPSELAKSMVEDDLQILNQEERIIVEEELNGRVFETTKFPIFKNGKPNMLAGFTVDITERKRAEITLRESEARFKAVSEYSHNAICLIDETGKIVWYNEAFLELGGYSRKRINDAPSFVEFLAPESIEFVVNNFKKFVNKEPYEHHYSFLVIRSDGQKRLCEKHMTDYEERFGKRILAISMVDITERQQAEMQIQEQLEELRRWHKITLGRENRILELKDEVNKLLAEAGQPPRYASTTEAAHEI